jgi:hypothetical protein
MAEVAAHKEAAESTVVEMQQEQIASAREIERLAADARAGAEAAATWWGCTS